MQQRGRKMLQHLLQHYRSMNSSIGAKMSTNSLAAMQFPGARPPPWRAPVVILLHCTI